MKNKKFKPPKYGILFAHPYIQQAPRELKGKVARVIASKLTLAAKTDFFSKRDRSKELKTELDEDMKRLNILI